MSVASSVALALWLATPSHLVPTPAPPPAASPAASPSALLRPVRGGYRWEGERVVALVRFDGVVEFSRKGKGKWTSNDLYLPFDPRAVLPQPLPPGTPTLEGTLKELKGGKRPPRPVGPEASGRPDLPGPQLVDVCNDFRDTRCIQQGYGVLLVSTSGTHGIADGSVGKKDPDRAEKAEFLATTTELRDVLARRSRQEALRDGLVDLSGRLEAVWRDPALTVPARRETLFRLWLEADPATPDGQRARAVVASFIRKRLPEGSPSAFPPDELRRLRGETGAAAFAPYGSASDVNAP